ncbi:hypothetical protein AZH53_10645 [Methanomicrobiaceae archaeon CYW5]|uniref:hypothetical protein n=1 Tax=Methanovulcanius yangii TaxID=1789227 RepID=UPI0029CA2C28|nr:hypothetical protein [Methanovulcanius yangii]MBT8508861.1 hypothetical protein [Methanovulcanius yangii]
MDSHPDVVERISQKIAEKGVTPDRGRIASKLNLLVREFSIPVDEAERTVTNEMMREYKLDRTRGGGSSEEPTAIASAKPGSWVTIEGKVIVLQESATPSIAQKGFIADASGAIEFVIWAKANAPVLEEGKWYRLESAVVDEFRDNPNLKVHSGTKISAIEEKQEVVGSIPAGRAEAANGGGTGGGTEKVSIASAKPGSWVTIEGKVIVLQESATPSIAQKGFIADASGAIEFVVWAKANAPVLEEGKWYRLESAVVDEFRDNPNLKVHSGTKISAIEEKQEVVGSIPAGRAEAANGGGTGGGTEKVPIASAKPNMWVTIEGKVVSLTKAPNISIAQKGIIADASGAIDFVAWAKANAPILEEGQWYRLESAVVDEFRGAPNIKIHSGTTISAIEEQVAFFPRIIPIADLTPGVVSVRAKVTELWEVRHERMLQTGLIGDETGTTKFVIWKSDGIETLEEGMVYTIYFASAEEYNGRTSLNLSGAEWCKEEGTDIEVSRRQGTTITGAFVHLAPSSGLIKRCKVEGCNRALSRQNFCPVHEIQQDFRYDLRIIGVVDDGKTAHNVIFQLAATEKVTGMGLQEAVEMAENNPLGLDDVYLRMQELLMGRYISCSGNDIDGTMLVREGESVELMEFDTARHAGLINRADPSTGGAQE